jgi:hypothetical protein
MPRTLADPATRAALAARLARLTPETPARWGAFTAPRMLAHVLDATRMYLGELSCRPRDRALFRTALVQWLVIDVLPFPRGAPTARELLERPPAPTFDADRQALLALLDRFDAAHPQAPTRWPAHPLFGPLTAAQWGRLGYKHTDHHLRQFGC